MDRVTTDEFRQLTNFAQAAELITDCGYYGTVEPADLAGVTLYGIVRPDTDELIACLAVLSAGAQAYVDYLVVRQDARHTGVATYLTSKVASQLQRQKVRVIHTCVSGENGASARMLMRFGAKIGWPYINAVVRLEDDNG